MKRRGTTHRTCRWLVALCVAALLAETSLAESAAQEANARPKVEQVIVVFKTHFDIGYTDLASKIVARYRTSMIDKALDVCDASRDLPPEHRFVWTLPGWPMAQILWPGQTAQRRQRIVEAIGQGRLVWHGLPVTTHTESLDLEDLVRGMEFSSSLSRRFGMPLPRDAKMTDVPSHTWILATVLRHAGIEFFHIGCNSAAGAPELPRLFWWEGPDGSRVLTMYEASGYGSGIEPPKDWPYRTWLGLIHTGDNHGPPTPNEVKQLLEKARRQLPGVKIRMGRLSDFADAILKENPELPVVRGDMPDTWIHGIMSMPVETHMARRLRLRTAALEALGTLLATWNVKAPDPSDTVAAAYEATLMFGEHTWGYSMSPFGYHYGDDWLTKRKQGHYERLEKSWAEKGAWIHNAQAAVAPALTEHMKRLGRAVNTNGVRIVVFNPLPWERDAAVSIDVPSARFASLKDLAADSIVPIEVEGTTVHFVARSVPPLGYRTYVPADESAAGNRLILDAQSSTIENRWYRVKLDPVHGSIVSIHHKPSARELVDNQSGYGFGQYLYEGFDAENIRRYFDEYLKYIPGWAAHFARGNMPPADEAPYEASSPKNFELHMEQGNVAVSAVMTAPATSQAAEKVSLKVTLYRDQPYVDLTWSIHNKRPDSWPEAGWLCFPLAVEEASYRLGRLGSVVDPQKDLVPGSNFDVFCLSSGMTVAGADAACVGICPIDSPLVSIGWPGLYHHTARFDHRQPVLFVNLFNNVWGTNFQQWTSGSWSCRVRLWAGTGEQLEASLITPSWEARNGCLAVCVDGPPGQLPPMQAGLQLSRKGVLVTAFGTNPNGEGTILRLWEQTGQSGPCRVTLPQGVSAKLVQPVDLRGRPIGKPLPVREGTFRVELRRFAPATLVIPWPAATDRSK